MMIELIGDTAGKIWSYLDENGESSITTLKKNLELKPDQTTMAIGWLAREDKLKFVTKGKSVKISINN